MSKDIPTNKLRTPPQKVSSTYVLKHRRNFDLVSVCARYKSKVVSSSRSSHGGGGDRAGKRLGIGYVEEEKEKET